MFDYVYRLTDKFNKPLGRVLGKTTFSVIPTFFLELLTDRNAMTNTFFKY